MKSVFSSHPQVEDLGVPERIQALLGELPKQEARVAQYMLLNLDDLVFQNGASIARKAGASEVTVSRLLRRLGYRGMAGLKRELRAQRTQASLDVDNGIEGLDATLKQALDGELRALVSVFSQTADPRWARAIRTITDANRVYVTGFQSVRGVAEDLSRRLALVRDDVRFFAAHDGMLGEWVGDGDARRVKRKDCVIIVDVVPYASEAPLLAKMSREAGRQLVVLTDELCHWAQASTDLVFHGPSRNGLAIESTVALTSLANLLVDAVARRNPAIAERRMRRWHTITRKLNVF